MDRRSLIRRGAGAVVAAGISGTSIARASGTGELPTHSNDSPRNFALIVLDRSGSMLNVRSSVIDGLNAFLDEQAKNHGMQIGLVQFDSIKTTEGQFCESIFAFTPVESTPRLVLNDYQPRSGTPLLAAIAEAVAKLERVIRPQDRALLVIQTDGVDNSSPPEITRDVVKQLIEAKQAEGNWTVVFLGADIDVWNESSSFGITQGNTLGYANTASGTAAAWLSTANSTTNWYNTSGISNTFYPYATINITADTQNYDTAMIMLSDQVKTNLKKQLDL